MSPQKNMATPRRDAWYKHNLQCYNIGRTCRLRLKLKLLNFAACFATSRVTAIAARERVAPKSFAANECRKRLTDAATPVVRSVLVRVSISSSGKLNTHTHMDTMLWWRNFLLIWALVAEGSPITQCERDDIIVMN